jgi:FdrA protein
MTDERFEDRSAAGNGDLLKGPVKVVNIGLASFAEELKTASVPVIQVAWSPPAGGDPDLADLVSKLGA